MAASRWRRLFRWAIPASLVAAVLAVPAAGLVSAVRAARRAAHAANTI
jgi:hypothetical protein